MNETQEPVQEEPDPRAVAAWENCYQTVLSHPRPNDGKIILFLLILFGFFKRAGQANLPNHAKMLIFTLDIRNKVFKNTK